MLKFLLVLSFMLSTSSIFADQSAHSSKINWLTNYNEAVNQSRNSGKPILLFFTGSDWCGWCHKLENEVLDTPEFADRVNDKYIFLLVDFPLKTPLEPALAAQNKELQQRFDVRGYPTIILLDDEQKQIGSTGYRPGGAKAYADYLENMVNEAKAYKQKVSLLEARPPVGPELESLYYKARQLCRYDDVNKIIQTGMKSANNRFFLLERYRTLSEEGFIHHPEALAVKEKLIEQDPENGNATQYEMAVIEFEAYSEEMERENYAPDLAVAPLTAYIEKFGAKDQANLWRLNMIISQVYLDHSNFEKALKYAKQAKLTAPIALQNEIAFVIKNIEER